MDKITKQQQDDNIRKHIDTAIEKINLLSKAHPSKRTYYALDIILDELLKNVDAECLKE